MSNIENKVVKLSFDSKDFDNGIEATEKRLNRFEKKLNFDTGSKGLQTLQKTINKLDFDGLEDKINNIERRMSTIGIASAEVIRKATDAAINETLKLYQITIGQIQSGGKSRATNIENAHFLLQGLLSTEEEVQKVMDVAMDSVDGTAYGFDAAAKAAAQFTASGLSVEELMGPLKAIAGVAATTSSDYESLSNIFTKVAGTGKAMTMELNQLSGYGINAASSIAEYLNKVSSGDYSVTENVEKDIDELLKHIGKTSEITEAEVRQAASDSYVTFRIFSDAMAQTFGDHAKKANETLTGALSNVKASLSRIGAEFYAPLIEQNGPLVKMFNNLRILINQSKKMLMPFINTILDISKDVIGAVSSIADATDNKVFINLPRFIGTINDIAWILQNTLNQLKPAFNAVFGDPSLINLIDVIVLVINRVTYAVQAFTAEMTSEGGHLYKPFVALFSILDAGIVIISKSFDILHGLVKMLIKNIRLVFGYDISSKIINVADSIKKVVSAFTPSIKQSTEMNNIILGLVKKAQKVLLISKLIIIEAGKLFVAIQPLIDVIADLLFSSNVSVSSFNKVLTTIGTVLDYVIDKIGKFCSFINELYYLLKSGDIKGFKNTLLGGLENQLMRIIGLFSILKDWFLTKIKFKTTDNATEGFNKFETTLGGIDEKLDLFVHKLDEKFSKVKKVFSNIVEIIKKTFSYIKGIIQPVYDSVKDATKEAFGDLFDSFSDSLDEFKKNMQDGEYDKAFTKITELITVFSQALVNFGLGRGLSKSLTGLGSAFDNIGKMFNSFGKAATDITSIFKFREQQGEESKLDKLVRYIKTLCRSLVEIILAIAILAVVAKLAGPRAIAESVSVVEVIMFSLVAVLAAVIFLSKHMDKNQYKRLGEMVNFVSKLSICILIISFAIAKILKVMAKFDNAGDAVMSLFSVFTVISLLVGVIAGVVALLTYLKVDTKRLAAFGTFFILIGFAINNMMIGIAVVMAVMLGASIVGKDEEMLVAMTILTGIISIIFLFIMLILKDAVLLTPAAAAGLFGVAAIILTMSKAIIGIVIAISIIFGILALTGKKGLKGLIIAFTTIAAIMAAMALFCLAVSKAGPFLLLGSVGVSILTKSLYLLTGLLFILSKISWKILLNGTIKLYELVLVLIPIIISLGILGKTFGIGLILLGTGLLLFSIGLLQFLKVTALIGPAFIALGGLIGSIASIIVTVFIDTLKQLIAAVGELIRELCRQIIVSLPYFLNALGSIFETLAKAILLLLDVLINTNFISEVGTRIMIILEQIVAWLDENSERLGKVIISFIWRLLVLVFHDIIWAIIKKIPWAFGKIFTYIKKALGINSPSKKFIEIGYYCVAGVWVGVKNAAKTLYNVVKTVIKTVIKIVITVFKTILNPVGFFFKLGSKILDLITKGLKSSKNPFLNFLGDTLEKAQKWIKDKEEKLKNIGQKMKDALKKPLDKLGITDAFDKFSSKAKDAFSAIGTFFNDNVSGPITSGLDALSKINDSDAYKTSSQIYMEKYGIGERFNNMNFDLISKWIEDPKKLADAWKSATIDGNEYQRSLVNDYDLLMNNLSEEQKKSMGVIYWSGEEAAAALIDGWQSQADKSIGQASKATKDTLETLSEMYRHLYGGLYTNIDGLVDYDAMEKGAREFAESFSDKSDEELQEYMITAYMHAYHVSRDQALKEVQSDEDRWRERYKELGLVAGGEAARGMEESFNPKLTATVGLIYSDEIDDSHAVYDTDLYTDKNIKAYDTDYYNAYYRKYGKYPTSIQNNLKDRTPLGAMANNIESIKRDTVINQVINSPSPISAADVYRLTKQAVNTPNMIRNYSNDYLSRARKEYYNMFRSTAPF